MPALNTSCEACRASKVKCSGNGSTCERCVAKGLICVYKPRKKRGQAKCKIAKNEKFPMHFVLSTPTDSNNLSFQSQHQSLAPSFLHSSSRNEVVEFCKDKGFPVHFTDALTRAKVTTFSMAAEISETELLHQFGPLPFDKLLLWRSMSRKAMFVKFCDQDKNDISTQEDFHSSQSSSFSEVQCAQVLSDLQQQQKCLNQNQLPMSFLSLSSNSTTPTNSSTTCITNSTSNVNSGCILSSFYNTFLGGCKRRLSEISSSQHLVTSSPVPNISSNSSVGDGGSVVTASNPEEYKDSESNKRMKTCDWLVSFLSKLSSVDLNTKVKLEEVTKELGELTEQESTVNPVSNIEQSVCHLKKKTLAMIEDQISKLKKQFE